MRFNAFRLALGQALLLLPDNRPDTRRAVMRGAVWMERAHCDGTNRMLPIEQRRRLISPFTGMQRNWVALGLALYGIGRKNMLLLPLATVATGVLLWNVLMVLVR